MLIRILIPILILAIGGVAAFMIAQSEEAPKPSQTVEQKLKTEISVLQRTDYPVILESQGVVRANHETTLTPTVAGTIIRIHPGFEDGAFFKVDEVLIELDPADFKAAEVRAASQLARARAALAQEEARAKQARLNWEDLGYEDEPSGLVLRIPQLKEARANVDAAVAELDQAERNLERTKIRAPFDGRVRRRDVGLGQAVGGSTPLGEIFATDYAEIRLPLTPDQLAFVQLPAKPGDPEVGVTLTDALGNSPLSEPATWRARIVRTEGALDESSRELFAIARIDDPYGLISGEEPLRIGQPVRAAVEGSELSQVFVIPRAALRGVNVIYLVNSEDPAIERTSIEPIWASPDVLIVREGLKNGQWLSTTRLPYAPDGAPVEVVTPAAASKSGESTDS
ncbi:MAG: efflux RND transporter periplasmic adaptor subunit [Verrucomicrobiota bacterium]